MIAALFVETGGRYFDLDGIDPWDEVRDARKYAGPYPVIAHPPCQRWGKMWMGSPSHVAKTGIRKIKGDDGGCFRWALHSVRKYGGVIEHPWQSHAWPHFGLTVPPKKGGVGEGRHSWRLDLLCRTRTLWTLRKEADPALCVWRRSSRIGLGRG